MKIVFLHLTMGIVDRGSEVLTDILAGDLSKKHEVTVIQSGKSRKAPYTSLQVMPRAKAPKPAPTNVIEKLKFRLGLDENSRAVKAFTNYALPKIRKLNPDIIVATNGAEQVRILKKEGLRSKIVVFGNAGIGYDDKNNLENEPNLFIALSRTAEKWSKGLASKKTKVVYIPNPIETDLFKKSKKAKLNLPEPVCITVGALTKYKNTDLVIEAVSKTPLSLLIVGRGEEEGRLRKLAEKLSPGKHMFITDAGPGDLPPLYKSASVFCFLPGEQESFGRVYLEAMASSLPIVAPNDPIRKEIVGEKGVYVNKENISEVRQAVEVASGMGGIDYSRELEEYKVENVVERVEEELNAIL